MDEDLISGFLSAIFSLSKELSIDSIRVMDMQASKFIYETHSSFIFTLNVTKDVDPLFGEIILTKIIRVFEEIINKVDTNTKLDKNLLIDKIESINFESKLDKIINTALIEYYFKSPSRLLEEIESYLISLFGSIGENVMNASIKIVCKRKQNFKINHLKDLISTIGDSLKSKISETQVKLIVQQLKNTFLSNFT
ncbi:MAG: hypothetical protein HWN65_09870 [Candidatus Helarchaeota archaeon]|nr:hypothetical protein [Candidatus Helarchaeota archaeon]